MQPIPSDVQLCDVWQWVNNGWFYHESDEHDACAARMENTGGDLIVHRTDGTSVDYVRDECFPHWPECGAVNLQGFAVIVTRNQSRQYRRTYNSRCVSMSIPRKWDVMKANALAKSLTADDPNVVNALFKPEYYTYTRALDLLGGSWVSVALNPHLVVAGNRDAHAVYYRNKLIATVQGNEVTMIDPTNPRSRRILKWLDGRVRYAGDS